MLLAAFVGTATNIAIPVLEEEFSGESLTHIAWVISGLLGDAGDLHAAGRSAG